MKHATQGNDEDFQPVETVLCEDLLTDLFIEGSEAITVWKTTGFTVKQTGMSIPDPT